MKRASSRRNGLGGQRFDLKKCGWWGVVSCSGLLVSYGGGGGRGSEGIAGFEKINAGTKKFDISKGLREMLM